MISAIDSTIAIQIINKLDEQAEFSKQQAEFSKQQAEFSKQQFEYLSVQFQEVQERLTRIEADVVVIKGVALSDFAGITASTKEDIQEAAEVALESKEEILAAKHYFDKAHPCYNSPKLKAARKEIRSFSVSSVINEYVQGAPKGYAVGCGQWVNAQLTKIFGERVSGKYAEPVRGLVAILVGYYVAERVSNGRLF